jgi:biotin carboxyl carrier protein
MEKKKQDINLQEEELMITDHPDVFQILSVTEEGRKYKTTFTKKFAARKKWEHPNPEEIKSFIPGTVEKIMVKKGQYLKANEELMLFVAMKMRNVICAPFDGKVEAIFVKEGDKVPKGVPMLLFKQKTKEAMRQEERGRRKKKSGRAKLENAVRNLRHAKA